MLSTSFKPFLSSFESELFVTPLAKLPQRTALFGRVTSLTNSALPLGFSLYSTPRSIFLDLHNMFCPMQEREILVEVQFIAIPDDLFIIDKIWDRNFPKPHFASASSKPVASEPRPQQTPEADSTPQTPKARSTPFSGYKTSESVRFSTSKCRERFVPNPRFAGAWRKSDTSKPRPQQTPKSEPRPQQTPKADFTPPPSPNVRTPANNQENWGFRPGATTAEIRTVYKEGARKYHPDKSSDPNATENFKAFKAAYDKAYQAAVAREKE